MRAMDRNEAFARMVNERLDALGMTAAALAREAEVTPQTVSKWRSGENVPPITRFARLEEILGLPTNHIARELGDINGEGPERPELRAIAERLGQMADEITQMQEYVRSLAGGGSPPEPEAPSAP